ncbi:hypothetical protein PAMP_016447 [Pampus punctatissimus]
MKSNHCLTIIHVSILTAILFSLYAESKDCDRAPDIKEHNTTYNVLVVEDLGINCTEITPTQGALWPYLYRIAGMVVFVIIVITICFASKHGCKGVHCARKSKKTPDPSLQLLPGGSPAYQPHIYENDPDQVIYINVLC